MLISIIASFSICGFLQIDLARVPDYYYPFIVWVIGLENMSVALEFTMSI